MYWKKSEKYYSTIGRRVTIIIITILVMFYLTYNVVLSHVHGVSENYVNFLFSSFFIGWIGLINLVIQLHELCGSYDLTIVWR